jgi:hypothetical protein
VARGTVVRAGERVGVVVEARPAAAPTKVKVLWEPLSALHVTEHDWPPAQATIVGVASLKLGRVSRRRDAAPADEPVGFADWLAVHVEEAARYGVVQSVPGAGTTRRAKLAQTFARLLGEGYSLEQFRAASVGVLDDDFMRANDHVAPESVLRVEKIGRRADAGARVLAKRDGDDTDWSAYDGG